jgi:hypothetical protein
VSGDLKPVTLKIIAFVFENSFEIRISLLNSNILDTWMSFELSNTLVKKAIMSLDELNTVFSRMSLLEDASLIMKMLFEFWNSLFKFMSLDELNVFDILMSFVLGNGLLIKILLEL